MDISTFSEFSTKITALGFCYLLSVRRWKFIIWHCVGIFCSLSLQRVSSRKSRYTCTHSVISLMGWISSQDQENEQCFSNLCSELQLEYNYNLHKYSIIITTSAFKKIHHCHAWSWLCYFYILLHVKENEEDTH